MSLTLALVGDVNCKSDEGGQPELAPSVVEQLKQAGLCIGNLEGALADPSVELHYKAGWFDCEPEMLRVVEPCFDVVGCANNVHALDSPNGARIACTGGEAHVRPERLR